MIVSLFVNPSQFNESSDLERYPRDEERDRALAQRAGADILFAPAAEEVYPPGFCTAVEVLGLSERLEGSLARRIALPWRVHHRHQAAVHGAAGLRLLRPEGRSAGADHPPPGEGPEPARRDPRSADGARARRTGDEQPQRPARRRRAPASACAARSAERGRASAPERASARPRACWPPPAPRSTPVTSSLSTSSWWTPRRSSRWAP